MKISISVLMLTTLTMVIGSVLFAQNVTKDVVYLKNGSIIKGSIIELIPEKSVKIQTSDGSIFVYTMSEIEKISKETVQSSEPMNLFGGGSSQSLPSQFSIFGGASIPTGEFAGKTGQNPGFAKIGFTAGAQFVTGGQIGFLINASYSMNSTELDEFISSQLGSIPPSINLSKDIGNWSSILLLAGLKVGTTNSTGANFFFAPVVGVNFVSTPKLSAKFSGTENTWIDGYYDTYYPYSYHSGYYANVNINGEINMPSVSNTVFVYGATVEAILGGITIGARYIACKPKFDMELKEKVVISGPSFTSTITPNPEKFQWEPSISLFQLYIGIAF